MAPWPRPWRWLGRCRRLVSLPRTWGWPPVPWWPHGGDYFGRTVNLASRIAGRAGAGQVLVTERVVEAAAPEETMFTEIGEVDLKGFLRPVKVFEARRS